MQPRALVINVSAPRYNLGARKLAAWLRGQGYGVAYQNGDPDIFALGYDLVALSAIFCGNMTIGKMLPHRLRF